MNTALKARIKALATLAAEHEKLEADIALRESAVRTSANISASVESLHDMYAARDALEQHLAEEFRAEPGASGNTTDKLLAVLAEGREVHRGEIAKVVFPRLTIEMAKRRTSTKLDQMKRRKVVAQVAGHPGVWKLGTKAVLHDGVMKH